ncbi:uncharacterized protein A1O5_13043 [Cladophialophora psammophila CBS 110553]|uniref:C2H2-type domain-containing protein n=1 Tax=Cladophialophora psammophila CBS 110553 TaxID=1182543 RepID=W9VDY6_9EURO|nr:uncharacterized protein A1O5_13043 [Cladophialophora psammophila CBS 110553]EXJ53688.1 hypothetical protein A1O5_13043 [Cladophialophora psammophila CBS 110553]
MTPRTLNGLPVDEHGEFYFPVDEHGQYYWESRTFKLISDWRRHLNKHERPYKCHEPGCELPGFERKAGLIRHQREVHNLHLSISFSCPFLDCERSWRPFSRKQTLDRHLQKCHGSMPKRNLSAPWMPPLDPAGVTASTEGAVGYQSPVEVMTQGEFGQQFHVEAATGQENHPIWQTGEELRRRQYIFELEDSIGQLAQAMTPTSFQVLTEDTPTVMDPSQRVCWTGQWDLSDNTSATNWDFTDFEASFPCPQILHFYQPSPYETTNSLWTEGEWTEQFMRDRIEWAFRQSQ